MSKRTASLVMANYNYAHFLKDSLTSIFSQTRPVDEVLVIDDASTDNSLEVLQAFQQKESRLRVLRNESNQGAVFAVNRGLHEATGDVVCFHSADDFIHPSFFQLSVGMLEACPVAGMCCSFFSTFIDSTKEVNLGAMHWSSEATYLSQADLIRVNAGGSIPGHSSVYLRQSVLDAGALIPELKWHCDWFLINVIAARTGICFIPAALAFLRINDGGSYSTGRANWTEQREVVKCMLRLLLSPPYQDVVPFFQQAGCLSHIAADITRLFWEEPDFLTQDELLIIFAMLSRHEQTLIAGTISALTSSVSKLAVLCQPKPVGVSLSR
jgi:glycosyltransferase involved in cell wall biosynthesis